MNIFYLDSDPKRAAQYHCDKHVIKMILETAQLLCTAHRELGNERGILNSYGEMGQPYHEVELYKSTHKNHPSAIWVRSSYAAYRWTFHLFRELSAEYTFRYGKQHATWQKYWWVLGLVPENIPYKDNEFTPPPQCMPDEYHRADTVEAYRAYYLGAKADIAAWNKTRPAPSWWSLP